MKKLYLPLGVLALAFILSGCNLLQNLGDTSSTSTGVTTTDTEKDNTTDSAMKKDDDKMMEGDDKMAADDTAMAKADLTIDMASFSFTPNTISMKAGETITVELTNSNGFHDLVIDELDIKSSRTNAGEVTTVEITAPASSAGESYEFYCSVGNHRALGMVGTLTIE